MIILLSQISGVAVSGYAANNSRALERRRSSVSEYVLSQDEEEGGGGSSSESRRRRRKVRRHVLTQAEWSTALQSYSIQMKDPDVTDASSLVP